jgi:hypothetical protein
MAGKKRNWRGLNECSTEYDIVVQMYSVSLYHFIASCPEIFVDFMGMTVPFVFG